MSFNRDVGQINGQSLIQVCVTKASGIAKGSCSRHSPFVVIREICEFLYPGHKTKVENHLSLASTLWPDYCITTFHNTGHINKTSVESYTVFADLRWASFQHMIAQSVVTQE